jgi:asparagine N-glycosylation enzyme membrane subunit Stt3
MDNKKEIKIAIVSVIAFVTIFIGADWWTGKSVTVPGTVQQTDMNFQTNTNNGHQRTTVHYTAIVTTNENMGMPVTVPISAGQYNSMKYGDETNVEISTGGITGWLYYARLK